MPLSSAKMREIVWRDRVRSRCFPNLASAKGGKRRGCLRERLCWNSAPARDHGPRCSIPLSAEMREEPSQQREDDADQEASRDREIKGCVIAAVHDVAGETAEAERQLSTEIEQSAHAGDNDAENNQSAAEIAERFHKVIIGDTPGRLAAKQRSTRGRKDAQSDNHPKPRLKVYSTS